MLQLFLQFELGKIIKYYKTKTLAKTITSFLFVLVFLCLGIGIYGFFISGFRYINVEAIEDIRAALLLFIYEIFLLVLSGIIIFSCVISSVFNLFRGEYNAWIMSSPGYRLFPKIILLRSLLSSIPILIIVFLPVLLAFTKIYDLGVLSLFFILVSVILFLFFLNALTLLIILLIGYTYYKISEKVRGLGFSFKGLLGLIVLSIVVVIGTLWRVVANIDLVELFKAEDVDASLSLSNMISHFNFLPTHPLAMEILNWQYNYTEQAFVNFLIIAILAIVMVFIWWRLSYLFYPLWQKLQEGTSKLAEEKSIFFKKRIFYHFKGGITSILFKKEVLVLSRNFKALLWFFFLSSLWLAQIGASVIMGKNIQKYEPDLSQKIILLQVIQYIIAIYFISSFTLRFVFPSFSVERKTRWILESAPLSFVKIFFGKYLFYTLFFSLLGVVMSYINSRVLGLSLTYTFYSTGLLITSIIFIVTLGLGLGALFPSTETDDPEVTSTSMAGLFFTALSLLYGALSDWVLYTTLLKGEFLWLLVFIILTLICIGIILVKVPALVKNKVFQ